MHFASHYRWLVATRQLGLPQAYQTPLLDVGTNAGDWPALIRAPLVAGLDLRPARGARVTLVQGNALALPFPAAVFGHVWVFDVIEHVPDDRGLLAEGLRVLRPGGCLWLSTTAAGYRLWPGGAVQRRLERSWGHVRRGYSGGDLRALVPAHVQVQIIEWNEPLLRALYVPLKSVQMLPGGPALLQRLIPLLYAVDARLSRGQRGHLFACLHKPAETGGAAMPAGDRVARA
jgi:SAM-dependent methyltransferase